MMTAIQWGCITAWYLQKSFTGKDYPDSITSGRNFKIRNRDDRMEKEILKAEIIGCEDGLTSRYPQSIGQKSFQISSQKNDLCKNESQILHGDCRVIWGADGEVVWGWEINWSWKYPADYFTEWF